MKLFSQKLVKTSKNEQFRVHTLNKFCHMHFIDLKLVASFFISQCFLSGMGKYPLAIQILFMQFNFLLRNRFFYSSYLQKVSAPIIF